MDGLNMGLIKGLPVELPCAKRQAEVAKRFSDAKESTTELQFAYKAKLQDLDDLRQSLLQKAFAGELT